MLFSFRESKNQENKYRWNQLTPSHGLNLELQLLEKQFGMAKKTIPPLTECNRGK